MKQALKLYQMQATKTNPCRQKSRESVAPNERQKDIQQPKTLVSGDKPASSWPQNKIQKTSRNREAITFWFRSILSELIGAAKESAEVNRKRALSGPVKVVVTNQPQSRRHTGVDLKVTSVLHNSSSKCSINICSLTGKYIARSSQAECCSNDQLITYRKRFCSTCESASSLIGNYLEKHQIMTWLLLKLNATNYVVWLQAMKRRILSPLPLGTAGMRLSEQTSNTTSNTLHEVRHSLLSSSSPLAPGSHPLHCLSVLPA